MKIIGTEPRSFSWLSSFADNEFLQSCSLSLNVSHLFLLFLIELTLIHSSGHSSNIISFGPSSPTSINIFSHPQAPNWVVCLSISIWLYPVPNSYFSTCLSVLQLQLLVWVLLKKVGPQWAGLSVPGWHVYSQRLT